MLQTVFFKAFHTSWDGRSLAFYAFDIFEVVTFNILQSVDLNFQPVPVTPPDARCAISAKAWRSAL